MITSFHVCSDRAGSSMRRGTTAKLKKDESMERLLEQVLFFILIIILVILTIPLIITTIITTRGRERGGFFVHITTFQKNTKTTAKNIIFIILVILITIKTNQEEDELEFSVCLPSPSS